ncbi:formylglycine-generating enzyme family protein [Sorangium sp. So ce426]|uniref:formylglycine-generating enzyme family protein n=1 Tax=Sorangium sp. So ce426 TaxID=3133312 RepID=UPI003F5B68AE
MGKLRARYARTGVAVAAVFGCSAAVLGCNSVLGIEDFDAAGCPSAGARRCLDSNTPQVCGADGSWESQPDCVDQVCDSAAGACVGECAPRATRCAGEVPQVCSDLGLWESKAACVDKTCSAELGACIGVCAAGQKRCDDNTLQRCDADGQWQDEKACSDQTCDATNEDGCVGVCVNGEKRCEDNALRICGLDGQWQAQPACVGQTCDADDGGGGCVGVCAKGQKRCEDSINTLQLCDEHGRWQDERSCSSDDMTCSVAAEGGCVGVCAAGRTRCEDNALHTCGLDGQWQAQAACVDQTCDITGEDEDGCVGVCAAGQKRCDADNNALQLCDERGQWRGEMWCSTVNQTCSVTDADGCTGVCAAGQKRCEDNALHTCGPDGQWQIQPACVDQTCDADDEEDGCVGVCAAGQKRCEDDDNTLQLCDTHGQWQIERWCSTVNQTCDTADVDGCAGVCAAGQKRCASNVPQECRGGAWESQPLCGGPTHCHGGECVVSCAPGVDVWCFGNAPYTCGPTGDLTAEAECESQTCINGVCEGECALGDARCSGNTPQTCDERGHWKDRSECDTACESGSCPGPSCEGLAATCGPMDNENCCLSPVVLGGSYQRSNMGAHPATVSDFRLDRYEITVGRFRKFVEAYPASKPVEGAGAHPGIAGSGWQPEWDWELPADRAELEANLKCYRYDMWTDAAGDNENRPMNCITWFEAFAFCAWDGGRLPTEAEWNYAAAGGSEQREYPWSVPPSSVTIDQSYAVHNCSGQGVGWTCGGEDILKVGVRSPKGDGKWEHADLAGGVWEWVLDRYDPYVVGACNDCANTSNGLHRVRRGGSWTDIESNLHSSERSNDSPGWRGDYIGARCARTP